MKTKEDFIEDEILDESDDIIYELDEVCNEIYRYPTFYGMEHLKEGVAVIRGEHINSFGNISTDWEDYWFVEKDVSNKFPRTILEKGDIIFTVRGTIGKIAVIDEPHIGAQISPNLIRISPNKDKILPEYLAYYLLKIKADNFRELNNNDGVIATVKATDLKKLKIIVPDIQIQKEIIENINKKMSKAELCKKKLIEQLELCDKLPNRILIETFESI